MMHVCIILCTYWTHLLSLVYRMLYMYVGQCGMFTAFSRHVRTIGAFVERECIVWDWVNWHSICVSKPSEYFASRVSLNSLVIIS